MNELVVLTAIGCADLQAPANAWLTRAGDNIIIRCNDTHETWYFTCQRGHWLGDAGNCSTGTSVRPFVCHTARNIVTIIDRRKPEVQDVSKVV